jgi:hypothetical protein
MRTLVTTSCSAPAAKTEPSLNTMLHLGHSVILASLLKCGVYLSANYETANANGEWRTGKPANCETARLRVAKGLHIAVELRPS